VVSVDGGLVRFRRVWSLALAVVVIASVGGVAVDGGSPVSAASGGYRALTPARLLDTRTNVGAVGPVPAGGSIVLDVTGVGGVPDAGVAAVVLNVTAVEATASTYVTVWPTGQPKPNTSNLNVRPGVDTPNLVIATVGADGTVSVGNQFGSVHLLADVTGWFPTGSDYTALTPERVLDTRSGRGAPGPLMAVDSIRLDVTGVGGVPDGGVAAVVLNVTAAEATENTYVSVWPSGQAQPNTSNLNVQRGVDTPNLVIATVGDDGTVSLGNQFGSVHLLADVTGWFPSGSDYHAFTPQRLLDTRVSVGAPGPVPAGGQITLDVTGAAGVPETGVAAVVLNVTAAEATDSTYVTVWPTGQPKPNTSNLNVQPGVDTPNLVIATVGLDGTITLANQFGSTHLLADITGWIPGSPGGGGRSGVLIGEGAADSVRRFDFADPQAGWRDIGTARDVFNVVGSTNELFRADEDVTEYDPFVVEIIDLSTFAPKESFTWPSAATRVGEFVVSPDGAYIAAYVRNAGTWKLEVVRRHDRTLLSAGLDGVVSSLSWTPTGDLAVALDLTSQGDPGRVSAIGVLPFAELAGGGDFEFPLFAVFDQSEGVASDIAVSPNGTEVLFTRDDDVWVMHMVEGATPHRVVTGDDRHYSGSRFSPDGSYIVVVRGSIGGGFQRQFAVPNDRRPTIDLAIEGEQWELAYPTDDNTILRVDAWLP
jgi:WD40 repeat protein